MLPEYVYVASSWRCPMQPAVIKILEAANIPCYDFRNPEGGTGFKWTDVDPEMAASCRCDHTKGLHGFCATHGHARQVRDGRIDCSCPKSDAVTQDTYLSAIEHPVAWRGYTADFEAMQKADTFILVLPCGRSAHLELGWAVGAGKRTAILLDDPVTPELMYKMVDFVAKDMFSLLGWLGVED